MTEIDLLKRSSFAWVDLFGTDDAMMANLLLVTFGITAITSTSLSMPPATNPSRT